MSNILNKYIDSVFTEQKINNIPEAKLSGEFPPLDNINRYFNTVNAGATLQTIWMIIRNQKISTREYYWTKAVHLLRYLNCSVRTGFTFQMIGKMQI